MKVKIFQYVNFNSIESQCSHIKATRVRKLPYDSLQYQSNVSKPKQQLRQPKNTRGVASEANQKY